MRLMALDYDPVFQGVDRVTFDSDTSIFDYDAVIWDPDGSFARYEHQRTQIYRNLPALPEDVSVQIQADAKRRKDEFTEFVNTGRTLIVVVRPPQLCQVDTGKREHSGTGRNRKTTRLVEEFDLLSALPVENCTFTRASGAKVELTGDGPIIDLLRKYRNFVEYDAVVTGAPGTACARVPGTSRVVGSIHRTEGGGHLVLIPAVYFFTENEELEGNEWLPEAAEFQSDLLDALENTTGQPELSRPNWARKFVTFDQKNLGDEVVRQLERVERARGKLAKLQLLKEAAERKDQLYLGTGRALELEVRSVFELLGGTVIEPATGRADWRVQFPEGDAVIEVKGLSKSAAEKHAAQLEKWVSESIEQGAGTPKGILVVNAWREQPLEERTEPAFPDQMLPYCVGRKHCLITGIQLFVIRLDAEANPERVEYWRNTILSTVGVFTDCEDWRSVMQIESPNL